MSQNQWRVFIDDAGAGILDQTYEIIVQESEPSMSTGGFSINPIFTVLVKKRFELDTIRVDNVLERIDDEGVQLYSNTNATINSDLSQWDNNSINIGIAPNNENAGESASIHNTYAIVGAPKTSSFGSVYIIEKSSGNWPSVYTQKITSVVSQSHYGSSVGIHSDYCIVGAPQDSSVVTSGGTFFIYERIGTWLEQTIHGFPSPIAFQNVGTSVAIYDTTAVISERETAGYVYIIERQSSGDWLYNGVQLQPAVPSGGTSFGSSLSIHSNYLAVGANAEGTFGEGLVYIFEKAGTWPLTETQKLTPTGGVLSDGFGTSVSLSGNYLIVGAPQSTGSNGKAYIFRRQSSGNWNEETIITAPDGVPLDKFGTSVSLTTNNGIVTVAIGAPERTEFTVADSGAVYIYELINNTWTFKIKLTENNPVTTPFFGKTVAIESDCLLVGSPEASLSDGVIYGYKTSTIKNNIQTNYLVAETITGLGPVDGVTVEGNINITNNLLVDNIIEKTVNSGVIVESVLLKDSNVLATNITSSGSIYTDQIRERTGSNGIEILHDVEFGDGVVSGGQVHKVVIDKSGGRIALWESGINVGIIDKRNGLVYDTSSSQDDDLVLSAYGGVLVNADYDGNGIGGTNLDPFAVYNNGVKEMSIDINGDLVMKTGNKVKTNTIESISTHVFIDSLLRAKVYGCEIYKDSTQMVNPGTTTVDLPTVLYDSPGTMSDEGNDRIRLPVDGFFFVNGNVYWNVSSNATQDIQINRNTTLEQVVRDYPNTSSPHYQQISTIVRTTSTTDTVRLRVFHNFVSAISIAGPDIWTRSSLTVIYLGGEI